MYGASGWKSQRHSSFNDISFFPNFFFVTADNKTGRSAEGKGVMDSIADKVERCTSIHLSSPVTHVRVYQEEKEEEGDAVLFT